MVAAVRGVVTSDLMFSMVSSGMGATVCTAGRFLLVAPLTKDEDEEEDEEAESVAPGWGGKSGESDEEGKMCHGGAERGMTGAGATGAQDNRGGRGGIDVRSDAAQTQFRWYLAWTCCRLSSGNGS